MTLDVRSLLEWLREVVGHGRLPGGGLAAFDRDVDQ
jgi:hypothetical protein